jgi:hypothetical protein
MDIKDMKNSKNNKLNIIQKFKILLLRLNN